MMKLSLDKVIQRYERVARGRGGNKVAVVAYTFNKAGKPRYFLITSTGDNVRWTMAKGSVEKGKSDKQVAIEECYEEAGVRVYLRSMKEIGKYPMADGSRMTVFMGRAKAVLRNWPEHHERARRKVKYKDAISLLSRSKKNKPMVKGLKAAHNLITQMPGSQ